jgi:hypothetical protein
MEHLLTTLRKISQQHDLPVLLIGGHAVSALGHPRSTFDVDLLIPRPSAPAWRDQLLPLGYTVHSENENFVQLEAKPDWPLPPIDLMLVDDDVFRMLHEERHDLSELPTPSPQALIALKLHAIHQPSRVNTEQDWSDVLALIEAQKLTLDDPSFSATILKHGGEPALERIKTHLAQRD